MDRSRRGWRPPAVLLFGGILFVLALFAFRSGSRQRIERGSAPDPTPRASSRDGEGPRASGGASVREREDPSASSARATATGAPEEEKTSRESPLLGLVADLVLGTPIPGARVRVEESGARHVAGPDGRFAIGSIPFPATLSIEAPGHTGLAIRLGIPPSGEIVIPLPPPLGLRAVVVGDGGFEPIRGAEVRIETASRVPLRSGTTDDEGNVELALERVVLEDSKGDDARAALEEAGAIVWAEAPGHTRMALPYALLSLRLDRKEQIELRRTRGIGGRVVDVRGAGIPKAHVYWVHTVVTDLHRERRAEETWSDEEGRFAIRAPERASACLVAAFHEAFAPAHAFLDLPAIDPDGEIRIVLEEPCVLRGEVRGVRGEPVVDAVVGVLSSSDSVPEEYRRWLESFALQETGSPLTIARSGLDGAFRIGRLRPGTYEIRVEHGALVADPGNDRTVSLPREGIWVARMVPGGRIAGQVLDADGNPPPSPHMILRPADRAHRVKVTPRIRYDERDGAFFAEGLHSIEYLLDVSCPGHESERRTVRPGDENILVVLARRVEEDLCEVGARFAYRGRSVTIPSLRYALHDPATGDPVARGITRVSSGYALLDGIPRRALDLVITTHLYRPVIIGNVRFDLPDPPEISVALEMGRLVPGRVIYEGPPERRPSRIALFDADGIHELFGTNVAEDGSFAFPNLVEGKYIPRVPGPPERYEPAEPISIGESDTEISIEIRAAADQGSQGS